MKWLLDSVDFNCALDDGHEWLFELFIDNGIIDLETAEQLFSNSSTDYDIPDCPFCGHNDNNHWIIYKGWKCKKCKNKFSIKTKRYLDNSKLPLTHWFRFCWIITEHKKANSCFIARDLGITQKSAWGMIDTLKEAMNANGMVFVNGTIEFGTIHDVMRILMKIKK